MTQCVPFDIGILNFAVNNKILIKLWYIIYLKHYATFKTVIMMMTYCGTD